MIQLTMNKRDDTKYIVEYSPEEHRLFDFDVDEIMKQFDNQLWFENIKTTMKNYRSTVEIRIALGKKCNFKCAYCYQENHVIEDIQITLNKIRTLVTEIGRVSEDHDVIVIQFWGGEPLLYIDTIKTMHKLFKENPAMKDTNFFICTNGSLLTDEITDWLISNKIRTNISYDGYGQYLRGRDILDNKNIVSNINRLLEIEEIQCTFLPVITKANRNFSQYIELIQNKLNHNNNVKIGEPNMLMVSNEASLTSAIPLDKLADFSTNLFGDLITGELDKNELYTWNVFMFLLSMNKQQCNKNKIISKCFAGSNNTLTVDINGDVVVCQSFNSSDVYSDGEQYKLCNISDLISIKSKPIPLMISLVNKQNIKCKQCAAYQFCKGGCPYSNLDYEEYNCAANFYLNAALLGFAMFVLTGDILSSIDTV